MHFPSWQNPLKRKYFSMSHVYSSVNLSQTTSVKGSRVLTLAFEGQGGLRGKQRAGCSKTLLLSWLYAQRMGFRGQARHFSVLIFKKFRLTSEVSLGKF